MMADIFISYSRKDTEFVQRLSETFNPEQHNVRVDWNIPSGDDWWKQVLWSIGQADTVICVISEHWLTSEICHKEFQHALENEKRILPIMRQQVDTNFEKQIKCVWIDLEWEETARKHWTAIRKLNWIYFDDPQFDKQFGSLIEVLARDQRYVDEHLTYQIGARRWESNGRNPGFLLTGDNLDFAEFWLKYSTGKSPEPTPLQREYIDVSRVEEDERSREAAEHEQRIRELGDVTKYAQELEDLQLKRTRQFRIITAILGLFGLFAFLGALIAVAQITNSQNNLATSTIVQGMALNQAQTATVARGEAENNSGTSIANARTATVAQGEAEDNYATAVAFVTVANAQDVDAIATLTQIPPTLTLAAQRLDAAEARNESLRLAALAVDELQRENSLTGALLSVRALNVAYSPEADDALLLALWQQNVQPIRFGYGYSAVYSPDGHYIVTASSGSGYAVVWNVESGTMVRFMGCCANSAVYSPDGNYIVIASGNRTVSVWEVESSSQVWVMEGHNDVVNSAVYSPNGRYIVSAGADGTAIIWDAEDGTQVRTLRGHVDEVNSVVYSPDGHYIVTASADGTAIIWDTEDGTQVRTLRGQRGGMNSAAYSPDGHYIITANADGTAMVWNAEDGTQVQTLQGHTGGVNSAVYSPDGRHIVTASDDGTAIIWDAEDGTPARILGASSYEMSHASFSPDGYNVVTVGFNNGANIWEANYHDFVAYACEFLSTQGDFSYEERTRFHIDDTPTCPQFSDDWVQAPTSTPVSRSDIPVWTPFATLTPSSTFTPRATSTPGPTSTPTGTATPTATSTVLGSASIGANRGEIILGSGQLWNYQGQAGETLTILVLADNPGSGTAPTTWVDQHRFDAHLFVYDSEGVLIAENDDRDSTVTASGGVADSDAELTISLLQDGQYTLEIRSSYGGRTSGTYTLMIESSLHPTATPRDILSPSPTP